jgi:hypothetical protein
MTLVLLFALIVVTSHTVTSQDIGEGSRLWLLYCKQYSWFRIVIGRRVMTVHITDVYVGYFWHVTDMHWDPTYVSTDVMPMSCGSANPSGVYSPYGDYRCDAPWNLINNSVYATRQLREDVDFLIWTG